MRIGFTGTRQALTDPQIKALTQVLEQQYQGDKRPIFRHGACKGADSAAAVIACYQGYLVIAHPGKSASGEDNDWLCPLALEYSHRMCESKTHFARNRDIVDKSDRLISCPQYMEPITKETKGGTAYTTNYARKLGRPVIIVRPDGTVEKEGDCD